MPIQKWSDGILLVELADDPEFTEEILTLGDRLGHEPGCHVVLNLGNVTRLSPTNVLQLMLLWEMVTHMERELRVCGVSNSVWSAMLVSDLDKFFHFESDVPSALTSLQLAP